MEGIVGASTSLRNGLLYRFQGPGGVHRPGRVAAIAAGSGVRGLRILDTVQDKMIERRENKEAQKFKEQIRKIVEMEDFNLNNFAKMMEEPLNSWAAKVPGLRPKEELGNLKKIKAVVDALSPNQRENPELIKPPDKKIVAAKAECTEEDVHHVLSQYNESSTMHRWLRARKLKGQRIPRSQEELSVLATDPRGITLRKFMKVKRSGSGRRPTGFSF